MSAPTLVKYGHDSRWVYKTVNGTVPCTTAYFGTDPAPNRAKVCRVA